MQWVGDNLVGTSAEILALIGRTSPQRLCEVASASDMPCFRPIECWPVPGGGGVVFSPGYSYVGAQALHIPCGQCIGCRLDKSREWSTRITHEASLWEDNCFVTLTYSDEHLPSDGSLSVLHTQKFVRTIRKRTGLQLRYFTVGEYGDARGRPHYHSILFGHAFRNDRVHWRNSAQGHPLYRSAFLEECWPYGHSEFGSVTAQSAGYCARYALKKINGKEAVDHYQRPHPLTGEIFTVIPEFARMSLKPGIGALWADQYRSDCFPSGYVIIDGEKRPVPRYYVDRAQLTDRELLRRLQTAKAARRKHAADNTPARLEAREELQRYRQSKLQREPEVS